MMRAANRTGCRTGYSLQRNTLLVWHSGAGAGAGATPPTV